MEARLIKDIQPKYNRDLKDDKTFPYLQITTGEDFPRVNFTREPLDRGVKLYGPFPRAKSLRGAIQVLQRIFKFRTCSLDIEEDDPRWRWFRPCLLHSINQCTAPCNLRIDRESYRADIRRLQLFLDGKKDVLLKEMEEEMREASKELQFEKAARLRDEIKALADPQPARQPGQARPARGLLRRPPQGAQGAQEGPEARLDSAHDRRRGHRPPGRHRDGRLAGDASSTACRSSRAIADTRSRACRASTTSPRSARSSRGGSRACKKRDEPFPDIWLIDGGKGQLSSALAAFDSLKVVPPTVIALAKQEEEIYLPGRSEPIVLSPPVVRPAAACNTSATRPTASPSIITTCSARNGPWARTNDDVPCGDRRDPARGSSVGICVVIRLPGLGRSGRSNVRSKRTTSITCPTLLADYDPKDYSTTGTRNESRYPEQASLPGHLGRL